MIPSKDKYLFENFVLLDRNEQEVDVISYDIARRLLSGNLADIIYAIPPILALKCETASYRSWRRRKARGTSKQGERLQSKRKPAYDNIIVENKEGERIFHTNTGRAFWYMARNLVEVIDNKQLRLRFQANGNGHLGDDYYLNEMKNVCVVCGQANNLTSHHVIPSCFRRHFPTRVKSHSWHDVLVLCVDCHIQYERFSIQFRQELGKKHGIKITDNGGISYNRNIGIAMKSASALLRWADKIPDNRKDYLKQKIKEYLQVEELTYEDLVTVSNLWPYEGKSEDFSLNLFKMFTIQEFTELWRNHFVTTMKPQFLPLNWSIYRPI